MDTKKRAFIDIAKQLTEDYGMIFKRCTFHKFKLRKVEYTRTNTKPFKISFKVSDKLLGEVDEQLFRDIMDNTISKMLDLNKDASDALKAYIEKLKCEQFIKQYEGMLLGELMRAIGMKEE